MKLYVFIALLSLLCPVQANPEEGCRLPPLARKPIPQAEHAAVQYDTGSFENDSHQFNPYSSMDNGKAGLHHDAKKPGEHGHWVTREYVVSCHGSDSMYQETYVNAQIVDQDGQPACETSAKGNFLEIEDASAAFPAYYGLSAVINEKLLPNGKSRENVSPYYNKGKPGLKFSQSIVLKYWIEDGAPPRPADANKAIRCKTTAEFDRSTRGSPPRIAGAGPQTVRHLCRAVATATVVINSDHGYVHTQIYGVGTDRASTSVALQGAVQSLSQRGADMSGIQAQPEQYVIANSCEFEHGAIAGSEKTVSHTLVTPSGMEFVTAALAVTTSEAKDKAIAKCNDANTVFPDDAPCHLLESW